jgi:aspartyl/asparaginyl beta-hydroxylase (cupin superfamily)
VPLDQWAELNHSKRWSVFYLWRDGSRIEDAIARCPRTAQLFEKVPKVDIPGTGPTCFFSILAPGAHIPPHTGVTNARAIVHVPLVIPPGCGFRVGSETREWEFGTAFVFDDTIEHEAWNRSDVPRAVLIFDIWNPYLTAAERDLVRATVAGMEEYNR